MSQVRTLHDLLERIGPRLKLRWLTPPPGPALPLRTQDRALAGQSLVGPLNCIHPNRIQVIGHAELVYLADLGRSAYLENVEKLFAGRPAAVIFADDIEPEATFFSWAQREGTPLLGSPLGDEEIIRHLQFFLTHELAERTTLHGVFMEVLGMGVLLVGDPAIGKSELALELINRGHRLVADDAPELANTAPETLEGTCPPLLRDFLEVRGLGILNIRAMFGESSVLHRKELNLIVNLRALNESELAGIDRLSGTLSARRILDVTVAEVTMPVAPGRNLAILVEAAVRNQILRMRGYDAGVDFAERQLRTVQSVPPIPLASMKR
jgi:HPr kinase/phosphorylase